MDYSNQQKQFISSGTQHKLAKDAARSANGLMYVGKQIPWDQLSQRFDYTQSEWMKSDI